MKKPKNLGFMERVGEQHRKNLEAKAAYKERTAAASAVKNAGRSQVIKAKGERAKAQGATTRTKYRAAAFASAAASKYSSEVSRNSATAAALKQWQDLIANKSEPADGTGAPNSGSDAGTGGTTTTVPVVPSK